MCLGKTVHLHLYAVYPHCGIFITIQQQQVTGTLVTAMESSQI